MKTRERIEKEMGEVAEQLRLAGVKYSEMFRTPKYDERYSAVKLENLQRDRERLQGKLDELQAQLLELVHSPEYLKAQETKVAQLKAKRETILKELKQVTEQLKVWQSTSQRAVAEGSGDAAQLANERLQLEEREKALTYAAQLLNGAVQMVSLQGVGLRV